MKIALARALSLVLVLLPSFIKAADSDTSRIFFSHPDMITARLSPSGEKVAGSRIVDGQIQLYMLAKEPRDERTLLNTAEYTGENAGSVSHLTWIDNRFLAVQFSEVRTGILNLIDTKLERRLLIIDTDSPADRAPVIYSVRTEGSLADPLRNVKGEFLYAKSGIKSKLYRIRVTELHKDKQKLGKLDRKDGGQFTASNELASVDGYAVRWFLDASGNVVSVLYFNSSGAFELSAIEDGQKSGVVKTWDDLETTKTSGDSGLLVPIALATERDAYYCLDYSEKDERSVYRVNFAQGTKELVYQTSSFRIVDLVLSNTSELTGVKVIHNGGIRYEFLNADMEGTALKSAPNELVAVYDVSDDGSRFLAYRESYNQPGRFSLIGADTQVERIIGERYPRLSGRLSSALLHATVTVEGIEIPYLVTIPGQPAPKQGHPLVVLPHGGPIGVFDTPYFDTASQYFAEQGFAVLRVNFRGSGGHTQELRDAGKKQWGLLMLEDIRQATLAVLERPDIDETRACIVGMSYGGYAAMMLTIEHPDIFKCGASVAGVADLPLFLQSGLRTKQERAWLQEHVGDVQQEHDFLKSISPVYRVAEIERPLLLVHGEKDSVVDVEHSYRMKLMLEKHGKPFEWHIAEDEGHSLAEPEKAGDLFKKLAAFLEQHN